MKIRLNFVSNSSTSSYICPVCNVAEAASDGCTLSDLDMISCEHNHAMHNYCYKKAVNPVDMIEPLREAIVKALKDAQEGNDDSEDIHNIARDLETVLASMDINEIREIGESYYYDEEDIDELEEKDCPVCTLQIVALDEIAEYLLKKTALTQKEISEVIKLEFGTYKKFRAFLYDEKLFDNDDEDDEDDE